MLLLLLLLLTGVLLAVGRIDIAKNYSPIEVKIREATNADEPWGPHGAAMTEIAKATFSYEEFPEAMHMLWKRMLKYKDTPWRQIYKVRAGGRDAVVE